MSRKKSLGQMNETIEQHFRCQPQLLFLFFGIHKHVVILSLDGIDI